MLALQTAKAEFESVDDGVDALIALHTHTVDALAGYAKMVEKAEPSFRSTAEDFRALHARHADGLARHIAYRGRQVNEDGSFMGTINKAVVSLRAIFDEIDHDVLNNVREGEKHVLNAFDDALSAPVSPAITADLRQMKDELETLLASASKIV
jgi:uncharacterized protein (TIGR02284 family)